jgi:hypothetical protein
MSINGPDGSDPQIRSRMEEEVITRRIESIRRIAGIENDSIEALVAVMSKDPTEKSILLGAIANLQKIETLLK